MTLDHAARQFVGVPFAHQGRNPAIALDCIGLLVCAMRAAGAEHLVVHDRTDYARHPHHGLLDAHLLAAFGSPVSVPRAGDIAAFRMGGAVRHVGVLGAGEYGLTLIHTLNSVGRVVEHRLDDKWRRRAAAFYRVEIA